MGGLIGRGGLVTPPLVIGNGGSRYPIIDRSSNQKPSHPDPTRIHQPQTSFVPLPSMGVQSKYHRPRAASAGRGFKKRSDVECSRPISRGDETHQMTLTLSLLQPFSLSLIGRAPHETGRSRDDRPESNAYGQLSQMAYFDGETDG